MAVGSNGKHRVILKRNVSAYDPNAGLKYYQRRINELATRKQWGMDKAWLMLGCYKEFGELIQSIEHGNEKESVAKEFGDVMHYLLQLMTSLYPGLDVDEALLNTIVDNEINPKKTYVNGKIEQR